VYVCDFCKTYLQQAVLRVLPRVKPVAAKTFDHSHMHPGEKFPKILESQLYTRLSAANLTWRFLIFFKIQLSWTVRFFFEIRKSAHFPRMLDFFELQLC